jgi:hypothetical protein
MDTRSLSHPLKCLTLTSRKNLKLIAFELAGEDRNRREAPVLSRLKIAFFALHKRGRTGFSPRIENFAANSKAISFTSIAIFAGQLKRNQLYLANRNLHAASQMPHTRTHTHTHTYLRTRHAHTASQMPFSLSQTLTYIHTHLRARHLGTASQIVIESSENIAKIEKFGGLPLNQSIGMSSQRSMSKLSVDIQGSRKTMSRSHSPSTPGRAPAVGVEQDRTQRILAEYNEFAESKLKIYPDIYDKNSAPPKSMPPPAVQKARGRSKLASDQDEGQPVWLTVGNATDAGNGQNNTNSVLGIPGLPEMPGFSMGRGKDGENGEDRNVRDVLRTWTKGMMT